MMKTLVYVLMPSTHSVGSSSAPHVPLIVHMCCVQCICMWLCVCINVCASINADSQYGSGGSKEKTYLLNRLLKTISTLEHYTTYVSQHLTLSMLCMLFYRLSLFLIYQNVNWSLIEIDHIEHQHTYINVYECRVCMCCVCSVC